MPTNTNKAAVAYTDKAAVAPEVSLGFSPGNKTYPPTGASAPGVCLSVPRKIATRSHHRKLVLCLTLASTLITSCAPTPTPKTTTHTT